MKNVEIKYNPYQIASTVTIDGKKPTKDSSINDMMKLRLQEWIDRFPEVLKKEYRDANFQITFTGSQIDYDDVVAAFDACKDVAVEKYNFIKKSDPTEAETLIDKIFEDIKKGPIEELKDKDIVDAFKKAKESTFEVNVVATMSSGKSTLINALLGKKLMPAANEATTATIVKIIDTEKEENKFDAIAYDKSHKIVEKIENVTLEKMKELNDNTSVSTIEIFGKIPFVKSVGMKLVLVDTPGPNNSRDESHREMTYRMLEDSDKTLVLYVMNGQQLGINDEKLFLDYVSGVMEKGGKQSRERFIFAINKMDSFKPKDEGEDCIEKALEHANDGLEKRNIHHPNLFPAAALPALEKRTDDDEPMSLDSYNRGIKKYPCLHFDNYYHYSHQGESVKKRINSALEKADDGTAIELHSGIVNIEQAIDQYVNKYAKAIKVSDLVRSFNATLNEKAAVASIEEAIRMDKDKKAELDRQIENVKKNIESVENAKKLQSNIDNLDLTSKTTEDIKNILAGLKTDINKLRVSDPKMVKKQALEKCKEIEKKSKELTTQVKVKLEKTIKDSYKDAVSKILDEYKEYLKELNLNTGGTALKLNPIDFVAPKLNNINAIVQRNTKTIDEGHNVRESYTVEKSGIGWGLLRGIDFLGLFDSATHETRYRDKWVSKNVDYVNMSALADEYLNPIDASIINMKDTAVRYVEKETKNIKETLKNDIKTLNKVLNDKMEDLKNITNDTKDTLAQIEKKGKDLKWLLNIQRRVNDIINF